MLRTVEALIDKEGNVRLLEEIKLSSSRRALVTIMEEKDSIPHILRPFGLSAGDFFVPEDFDAPLPEDVLRDFEGA